MEQLFEVSQKVLEKPIVIYGAGNAGLDCFCELFNRNIYVKYFCDSSPEKWGIRLANKVVLSPEELYKMKDNVNIVIASMFFEDIQKDLMEKGITNLYCYKNHWRVQM